MAEELMILREKDLHGKDDSAAGKPDERRRHLHSGKEHFAPAAGKHAF